MRHLGASGSRGTVSRTRGGHACSFDSVTYVRSGGGVRPGAGGAVVTPAANGSTSQWLQQPAACMHVDGRCAARWWCRACLIFVAAMLSAAALVQRHQIHRRLRRSIWITDFLTDCCTALYRNFRSWKFGNYLANWI
jgi:hypothetical protein